MHSFDSTFTIVHLFFIYTLIQFLLLPVVQASSCFLLLEQPHPFESFASGGYWSLRSLYCVFLLYRYCFFATPFRTLATLHERTRYPLISSTATHERRQLLPTSHRRAFRVRCILLPFGLTGSEQPDLAKQLARQLSPALPSRCI